MNIEHAAHITKPAVEKQMTFADHVRRVVDKLDVLVDVYEETPQLVYLKHAHTGQACGTLLEECIINTCLEVGYTFDQCFEEKLYAMMEESDAFIYDDYDGQPSWQQEWEDFGECYE